MSELVTLKPVPKTKIVSQNGIETAAMTMEIARNTIVSRGELRLLTRVSLR